MVAPSREGGGAWTSPPAREATLGRRKLRRAKLCQRRRPAFLQALHPQLLPRTSASPGGDAAWLHPVAGGFRRRHANERAGRRAGLLRRLSQADARGQCPEMLELVQRRRSAARPWRALADRRDHPADHGGCRGRPGPRLRRRPLRGRCRGRHHGRRLSRSLCRRRRPFRAGLRGRQRCLFRLRRDEARRQADRHDLTPHSFRPSSSMAMATPPSIRSMAIRSLPRRRRRRTSASP